MRKTVLVDIVFKEDPFTVNRARDGYSGSILAAFYDDVISLKPQYVLLQCGTTDSVLGMPLDEFMLNIKSMLDIAKENSIIPIICTPPPTKSRAIEIKLKQYRKFLRGLDDVHLFDFHEYLLMDEDGEKIDELPDDCYVDGVYFNFEGHKLMAKTFNEYFAEFFCI